MRVVHSTGALLIQDLGAHLARAVLVNDGFKAADGEARVGAQLDGLQGLDHGFAPIGIVQGFVEAHTVLSVKEGEGGGLDR